MTKDVVTITHIEGRIFLVRGHRIMLDADLADLYGVTTKALNQAVKRNVGRFPEDFVFRLADKDVRVLRSQIVTSNAGRGGRRYAPYAFTEHGAIMAANVLNSRRAVDMSVLVVRAFVRLREVLASHRELARRFEEPERHVARGFKAHDDAIRRIVAAIRKLMEPRATSRRRIGFRQP
jgi:hypothetical protein